MTKIRFDRVFITVGNDQTLGHGSAAKNSDPAIHSQRILFVLASLLPTWQ